eukprot:scaffold1827_cov421-Prasinococcus_capsulatus_cf.AAC.28
MSSSSEGLDWTGWLKSTCACPATSLVSEGLSANMQRMSRTLWLSGASVSGPAHVDAAKSSGLDRLTSPQHPSLAASAKPGCTSSEASDALVAQPNPPST